MLLLPPPQPGDRRIRVTIARRNGSERRRAGALISRIEKNIKVVAASHPLPEGRIEGRRVAAVPLVVVTVTVELVVVAVPVALIEEGLNTHAAPAGSPEQAREIVPLNPVDEETATEVDPDPPGAVIPIPA